jgi:hypothetical protein
MKPREPLFGKQESHGTMGPISPSP